MVLQLNNEKKEAGLHDKVNNLRQVGDKNRKNANQNNLKTLQQAMHDVTRKSAQQKTKHTKDYAIMDPGKQSNGLDSEPIEKLEGKFKSRYVDDDGLWTRESVDDGYVEFKDYIKDRREGVDNGVSFNGKKFNPDSLYLHSESFATNEYEDVSTWNNLNQYEAYEYEDEETFRKNLTANGKTDSYYNLHNVSKQKNEWVEKNIGGQAAFDSAYYKESAYINAALKMRLWGLDTDNNNVVDAYRHFIWNAMMTRDKDVGYYNARNITNRYEYEELISKNWVDVRSNPYDYKKDNTKIRCRMNQPMLMDIWNNQVARELANNSVFKDMNVDELFKMALEYGWLITDATQVYDFLGITEYIMDPKDYYVNAEWDLTTNNIVFKKNGMWVELKIGV